jgi:hypothetical protein
MKKTCVKFFLIFSCAFCCVGNATFAQNTELRFPHWYISLYSGFNIYATEGNMPLSHNQHYSLWNNTAPQTGIGGGYDFSPVWGIRGQLGWMRYRWFDDATGYYGTLAGGYLTADLMYNITRALAGFNPDRIFDLQIFIGTGAECRPGTSYITSSLLSPVVRFGLQGNFHLGPKFDINLNFDTNFLSDRMDNRVSGHFADNATVASLGFTYHLVSCHCKKGPEFQ